MKAKKYFMDIYAGHGSLATTRLSGTVFTANLKTAKAVAEKIAAENSGNFDEIKIISVRVIDRKTAEYSHISPAGEICGVPYGL